MNRKLKILMLAPTTVVGGITTWLRFLLKYSDSHSMQYKIIDTSKLYETFDQRFTARSAVFAVRNAIARLYELVVSVIFDRPDLVYFTCAPSLGYAYRDTLYLFLMRIFKMHTVVHMHGGNVEGFFGGNPFRRFLVINALKTSALILVITRETEAYAQGVLGSKVVYMPNMFDDEMFRDIIENSGVKKENDDVLTILHVAWQSEEKGTIDLIKAISRVNHKVKCYLVGTSASEFKAYAEKLISDLSLSDSIMFVGQKTGKDLQKYYTGADLFVFPTHREGPEGFPMVILEAMAYGLPIIANEVGNIREMVGADEKDFAGILLKQVTPIDPIELAHLIDEVSEDQTMRSKMGHAGKSRIKEKYLASTVVPLLENTLREAVPDNDAKGHAF